MSRQRVAPAAAAGAAGADQPEPVVGAQGLRVQPGELGGDADDVDRDVGPGRRSAAARRSRPAPGPVRASNRLARRSAPAVASR